MKKRSLAMNDAFIGGGFSASTLLDMNRDDAPDLVFRDTLAAQCFDALPSVIKIMNAAGRIVFYNRAAFQYYGPRIAWARWPHECDDLFHGDDQEARRLAREKVFRLGVGVRVDLRTIRFDYTPRWHEFDLTPLFDSRQLVAGILIRMTDIQDRRRETAAAGGLAH